MEKWNDLRPDAQAFDEVRIVTVPRYKQSGLSGDEWRISASIQLYRKGKLIVERGCGTIEAATVLVGGFYLESCDNGKGFFAGDGIHCDQEGCSDAATVCYRKKFAYCQQGHKTETHAPTYRHFCERHKRRGDCGMDDADANYAEEPMSDR
jgi:hypothetical protein